MGLILILIHAVISFAVGKAVVNVKPEIANWSINKKQAITLVWFFLSVLFWAVIKTIQLNSSIEEHIFSSFGTSIIMGMIFYHALKPKKQTA